MLNELNESLNLILLQTWSNRFILAWIVAIVWGAYLLTLLSGYRLLVLGIIPRRAWGLLGIFFAPFLHGNFNHLFFNTIPLIVLSNFILINGLPYYLGTTFALMIVSGVLTWLIAKPGIHVGASSIITGYWAILALNAFDQPSLTSWILGAISIYYFAGIFFGIFPSEKGVSWEGHLSGLIAGVLLHYGYLASFTF